MGTFSILGLVQFQKAGTGILEMKSLEDFHKDE
jgi:hypothetical protein